MRKRIQIALLVVAAVTASAWIYADYRSYKSRARESGGPGGYLVTRTFLWLDPDTSSMLDHQGLRQAARDSKHSRGHLTGGTLFRRIGPRPRMLRGLPHRQMDQHPPEDMRKHVAEQLAALTDTRKDGVAVRFGASRWEGTGAGALTIGNCTVQICHPSAIRADGEFLHLHSHGGSVHLLLALPDAARVIERGWGERFALSPLPGVPNVVLVYAPRTKTEYVTFRRIVRASFLHATWGTNEQGKDDQRKPAAR